MPASKKVSSLDLYSALSQQIAALKDEHEDVFMELASLEDKLKVAEENVKSEAREVGEGYQNKFFAVKVVPSTKKWFDFSKIREMAKSKELDVITERAVRFVDVDPKAMQELVLNGDIRPEIVRESFREEAQTTRVSIVPLKTE